MSTTQYLQRLGFPADHPTIAGGPTVDGLTELHRAHVAAVPYETLWLHGGEAWGIDPAESFERIATTTRGGYCFQLNGAFGLLLADLGYRVTVHSGAVHDVAGPTAMTLGNHACLVVHDLRTAANPGGRWYVDVGLGDALHAPLPLVAGRHFDRSMRFTLTDLGLGRWQFAHDPAGTFAGMRFSEAPAQIGAFSSRHQFNATSPKSTFANLATVQRRHADGSDVLRGCVLTRRSADGVTKHVLDRRGDWLTMLDEVFGIRLDVEPVVVDRLWNRMRTAHEDWLAAELEQALDGDRFATAV